MAVKRIINGRKSPSSILLAIWATFTSRLATSHSYNPLSLSLSFSPSRPLFLSLFFSFPFTSLSLKKYRSKLRTMLYNDYLTFKNEIYFSFLATRKGDSKDYLSVIMNCPWTRAFILSSLFFSLFMWFFFKHFFSFKSYSYYACSSSWRFPGGAPFALFV